MAGIQKGAQDGAEKAMQAEKLRGKGNATTTQNKAIRASIAKTHSGFGCLSHLAINTKSIIDGTITSTPAMGPVLENTMNTAVATSTESGVLSCPNTGVVRHSLTSMSHGFGQGARIRKVRGVAVFTFSTPCPPNALEYAEGGFQSHTGAKTMQTQATPKAATKGNAPTVIYSNSVGRHAAIENSLSTALHLVRNGKTIADIQRAMSRAMRAATLLKQTCDTVNVLKGGAA
ncbi:hypothetical protein [Limnohabitans sp.]|uniref:hypothetical protein n=1 Tax=Limnohabitans sp. TaxID=1907725 RepID=UPI00286EBF52|nr:hypothetical protein [Limnohabitans sp.]